MKIFACDIDNTISDQHLRFLYYSFFNPKESIYESATKEAFSDKAILSDLPIKGAQEAIKELAKYYEIVYVSARKPEQENITREWLKKYKFPINRLYLVSQNNFKLYTLRQLKPVVFVDDMKYNWENFEPKFCTDFMSMLEDEGINYEIFDNNWSYILQKYKGVI